MSPNRTKYSGWAVNRDYWKERWTTSSTSQVLKKFDDLKKKSEEKNKMNEDKIQILENENSKLFKLHENQEAKIFLL